MKKIEEKVLTFIDEKNLINPNDKILIGLSGGPDSVFLLYFLHKFSKGLKISLGALHINHLLRGKEADDDEKFCRALTQQLGIKYYSIKKDTSSLAVKKGYSIEEAGRIIRYKEFEKFSLKYKYSKIATAHNSDDNAETVLLNLIKGAGLKGISGVPFKREKIIRPILVLTKKEIISYLESNKIKYRIDISNLDDNFERNFLRNKIIPQIQDKLNPSLIKSIFKSSEVFKEINFFLTKQVQKLYYNSVKKNIDSVSISLSALKSIDDELLSEFFRYVLEKKFTYQLSFDECKKIVTLFHKQTGKSISLSTGIKIFKERSQLVLTKSKNRDFVPVKLKVGQSFIINNSLFHIKKVTEAKINDKKQNVEFINAEKIKNGFTLRRWKDGDKFVPLGMKGKKKISDFLNEQKLESYKKREQLILENDNKIVWVVGLRLDDRFKILPDTKEIYKLWIS